ncbi:MAG: RDD family protein, partial [Candidatus Rokuibacteriota bacterium]
MIEPRPAGFWIRAMAAVLDFAVFSVVLASFRVLGARAAGGDLESDAALRPVAMLFTLVFAGAYTSVLHHLAGQTIGKMLVGVWVV